MSIPLFSIGDAGSPSPDVALSLAFSRLKKFSLHKLSMPETTIIRLAPIYIYRWAPIWVCSGLETFCKSPHLFIEFPQRIGLVITFRPGNSQVGWWMLLCWNLLPQTTIFRPPAKSSSLNPFGDVSSWRLNFRTVSPNINTFFAHLGVKVAFSLQLASKRMFVGYPEDTWSKSWSRELLEPYVKKSFLATSRWMAVKNFPHLHELLDIAPSSIQI